MINEEASDTAAAVTAEGATVAPPKTASKKVASHRKGAPKARNTATGAKRRKQAKTEKKSLRKAAPRAESKGEMILQMIGRPKGATLSEIMKATGWQAHSVRGFISSAGKKHNVKIESDRNDAGHRVYRITK